GNSSYFEIADNASKADGTKANSHPLAYASLVMANLYSRRDIPTIVITAPSQSEASSLLAAVHKTYLPARIITLRTAETNTSRIPITQDKPITETAQAYVCSNFTCAAPVSDPSILVAHLTDSPT